ncbi:putative eka-like protein [Erysiphe necator]|uniref:Putative eka-like protein n=1 Tax=Uncinula necator TaxID=52586 RepID=A0A0B1P2R2_UNCNE|nr:putative eka-like protein [Erysiphe necator]
MTMKRWKVRPSIYLPKELAEIIAVRQRRERVWHARLTICTSVISSIDSTLENYKDDISKAESASFKTYLSQAISKFTAYDHSPSPPPIFSHTRPKKSGGPVEHKLPNRPISVVTPFKVTTISSGEILEIDRTRNMPQEKQSTWATVVRKGKEKAWVSTTQGPVPPYTTRYNQRSILQK